MKHIQLTILCFAFCSYVVSAQHGVDTLRIMSYNTENFFDCEHDRHKEDHDWTPDGLYNWTPDKFNKKRDDVAGVISSVGEARLPALVGLCEIENEKVLIELTQRSPLKSCRYKYIHKESPDIRGVDVALLYQENKFIPLKKEFIQIDFPNDTITKTRDILHAVGLLENGDTLHVFVAHFPSRYKSKQSENQRIYVASVLKAKVNGINSRSLKANIIILGDFNDCPHNPSISKVLKALKPNNSPKPDSLYNLYYQYQAQGIGSYKYKGVWNMFDQIIVSGNMMQPSGNIYTNETLAKIYDADFLLENDTQYFGKKPFRTYWGIKYHNGYSDHLPIYTDFIIKKNSKQ